MRAPTIFSQVKVPRTVRPQEQIEVEDARAYELEKLKLMKLSPIRVKRELERIYEHLPESAIDYMAKIFIKYKTA